MPEATARVRLEPLLCVFGAALFLLMLLLSPVDLELARSLHRPGNTFGRMVLLFGEWPGWIAVLLAALGLALGRRRPRLREYRPLFWSVIWLALIHPLLITQGLKFGWGRVRPADLSANGSDFTPFYRPAGPGAGESFPSGHVAMSVAGAPLPFFLWRRGRARAAAVALSILLAIAALVSLGRMVAGAHYLTDCLFSAGLAFLLAPALERHLSRAPPATGAGTV
jgi:membrane-associated phospholipid phosphatase